MKIADFFDDTNGRWFLTGFSAAIVLISGVTYSLGHSFGEASCAFYTDYEKVNVQDATKNAVAATLKLDEATTKFIGLIDQTKGYQELVTANAALKQVHVEQAIKIDELTADTERLTRQVKTLTPPTLVKIDYGHAEHLAEGITVGLDSVSSDAAYMTVDGIRDIKHAGEQVQIRRSGKTCTVTLRQVGPTYGAASAVCQ